MSDYEDDFDMNDDFNPNANIKSPQPSFSTINSNKG